MAAASAARAAFRLRDALPPTVVTRAVSIIPTTNNLPHFIINPSFFFGCPVCPKGENPLKTPL